MEELQGVESVFYLSETLHFVGLCLLLGALLLVDLRLLGLWRSGRSADTFPFMRWAVIGFGINAITGFVMFGADPYNYRTNSAFHIKLILIALAGLKLVWFAAFERRRVLALADGAEAELGTKISAALSLAQWFAIVIAGRLLPSFEGDGACLRRPSCDARSSIRERTLARFHSRLIDASF
jgi:hypothetical protein